MKKTLLATLADKNYINHAKQLFSSVYFNAGWQGDYMLLAHEIPEKDLKWFKDKGILVKECEPIQNNSWKHNDVTLDKFYLFTPEFKKWDNIVFLDVDIIVRYSLDELTNLKGFNAISEFQNHSLENQYYLSQKITLNQIKEKFEPTAQAFNTGVMVFDTNIINENSFKDLQKIFFLYNDISKFAEQLFLNLYFYKNWKKINFLYNLYIPYCIQHYHLNPKKINGIILHFLGFEKPWFPDNPFYNEWKTNLEKAELIDLKNIPNNIKIFKENKKILYLIYINLNKTILDICFFINKKVGLIGLLIKKYFPIFYKILNKIKTKNNFKSF